MVFLLFAIDQKQFLLINCEYKQLRWMQFCCCLRSVTTL